MRRLLPRLCARPPRHARQFPKQQRQHLGKGGAPPRLGGPAATDERGEEGGAGGGEGGAHARHPNLEDDLHGGVAGPGALRGQALPQQHPEREDVDLRRGRGGGGGVRVVCVGGGERNAPPPPPPPPPFR